MQRHDEMTVDQIDDNVADLLQCAEAQSAETHLMVPGSYGDGYDAGFRDALRRVLCFIRELESPAQLNASRNAVSLFDAAD